MPPAERRPYIDWARGLAVLLMIEAHTVDAWTRAADRSSTAFGYATILGGFAAPLFLWLAGLGVALSAGRAETRTGSRRAAARAAIERGLEIFVLAFLFRLQAFVISPGSHPIMIFRVDVLNVMGPSIVLAGILWAAVGTPARRITVLGVCAAAIAMATPIVRSHPAVDSLPTWLQWYLRPAGELTTFTMLPWSAFVIAGAAAGVLFSRAHDAYDPVVERRALLGLGIVGLLLVAAGVYAASRPTIYTVPSFFWTSSPTWFAIRVGILMTALSLLGAFRVFVFSWQSPLAKFGRASLFIYWIHVDLVYGYASWLWRHRLPLWGTALAAAAFTVLLYRAIGLRDLVVAQSKKKRAVVSPQGLRSA